MRIRFSKHKAIYRNKYQKLEFPWENNIHVHGETIKTEHVHFNLPRTSPHNHGLVLQQT